MNTSLVSLASQLTTLRNRVLIRLDQFEGNVRPVSMAGARVALAAGTSIREDMEILAKIEDALIVLHEESQPKRNLIVVNHTWTYDAEGADVRVGDSVLLPTGDSRRRRRQGDRWVGTVTAVGSTYTGEAKKILGVLRGGSTPEGFSTLEIDTTGLTS
jgi:hypothetical protein